MLKKLHQIHFLCRKHGKFFAIAVLLALCSELDFCAHAAATNAPSKLIEAAGTVDYFRASSSNWNSAKAGLELLPGDRVRTKAKSRAAVQLSDRSIIRLDELTTLEILPPRNSEKKRFGLPAGSLYFFNREKPADVEFDTPLASGAIRGTEFLLEVAEAGSALHLALIDGLVSLNPTNITPLEMKRGEDLELFPGKPPVKTALLNATAKIQWALYYPAVVYPEELQLDSKDQNELASALTAYAAGDILSALRQLPGNQSNESDGGKILRAQLELAVGGVTEAEGLIGNVHKTPAAQALRKLIGVVRNEASKSTITTNSVSLLLALSYQYQLRGDLPHALDTAGLAAKFAPDFGYAHARLAELEFASGHRKAALKELSHSLLISPRLAQAWALKGFVYLDDGSVKDAAGAFDRARELNAGLGSAWLGRGLCLLHDRNYVEARASFQTAAALEPQRGLFRSYLGKAASSLDDDKGADKEFRLAKELDSSDPTAWFYSALSLWQENKLNAAIRDLETSSDKNDNRAAFRSRELLDGDRSVRSANLAAIYDDAGLSQVSAHIAARAVDESYLNFSGHLFLANSFQAEQSANRFDLRLETARQSELLVANLLAPPGAGNLSQVLSEQERIRYFEQSPVGASSLTTYGSRGDWTEAATVFGSQGGFSYAFDAFYESLNGQRTNNDSLQKDFAFTAKQRIAQDDEAYFQVGTFQNRAGDVSSLYDPASATPGLRVEERQDPDFYAGWHHAWSPGIHTLFLAARLEDNFKLTDPQSDQIFLIQSGDVTTAIQSPPVGPPFTNEFSSHTKLYSAELQQVFETEHQSLIVGGRIQSGDLETTSILSRELTGIITQQTNHGHFLHQTAYGYYTLRPFHWMSLIGGITYDHLEFPENTDFPPLSPQMASRNKFSPKAGLIIAPWDRGLLRASYTRSIGGLFFDNSIRLEPTQVGGFNQAFRSLIPESVAGLLPGAAFETANAGFDQSFASGTFFGLEAAWLTSKGERTVGALTNSFFLPIPDSPSGTRQTLAFRERNASAYAGQLIGDYVSASARYRLSEAKLVGQFPDIPRTAFGLEQLEQTNRAIMQQVSLGLNINLPNGLFAQWDAEWYHQVDFGYSPELERADFWQNNFMIGYRFAKRRAEAQIGLANVFNKNYKLNPLNLSPELPRTRTLVATLRINF